MEITNKNKGILLVDDDVICNFITKKLIEKLDYKHPINITTNGKAALEFIEMCSRKDPKTFPELVLLDINMPIMDGWDFTEAFKGLSRDMIRGIHIVMLTSSISPHDIRKAADIECIKEFVTKPLELKTMREILERYT